MGTTEFMVARLLPEVAAGLDLAIVATRTLQEVREVPAVDMSAGSSRFLQTMLVDYVRLYEHRT